MTFYRVTYRYKDTITYREIKYQFQSMEAASKSAKRELASNPAIADTVVTKVRDDVLFTRMARYEREVTA